LNVFVVQFESFNNPHCGYQHQVSPKVKFKLFMFLVLSKVTKYVPISADVGTYMV